MGLSFEGGNKSVSFYSNGGLYLEVIPYQLLANCGMVSRNSEQQAHAQQFKHLSRQNAVHELTEYCKRKCLFILEKMCDFNLISLLMSNHELNHKV